MSRALSLSLSAHAFPSPSRFLCLYLPLYYIDRVPLYLKIQHNNAFHDKTLHLTAHHKISLPNTAFFDEFSSKISGGEQRRNVGQLIFERIEMKRLKLKAFFLPS